MLTPLIKIVLFISIAALSALYFTTVTNLSYMGDTIFELRQELTQLQKQNRELTMALNTRFQISQIEKIVMEQGLVFDTHFVYVKTPSALAVSKR